MSEWTVGETRRLETPVASVEGLFEALAISVPRTPRPVLVAPGVALIHASVQRARPALDALQLAHPSALDGPGSTVNLVFLLTAPLEKCNETLRVASRLMAWLQDPDVAAHIRSGRGGAQVADAAPRGPREYCASSGGSR